MTMKSAAHKIKTKDGNMSRLFRGWNELKVSGKLPERRSYHVGAVHDGSMYVFGGQDLKVGSVNTTWKVDIESIVRQSSQGQVNVNAEWEYLNVKGTVPEPMSHHSSFVHDDKLYCYGGLIGSQGGQSNGDLWILDLNKNTWSKKVTSSVVRKGEAQKTCEARDDHASAFDPNTKILYVFGGYVNGDKSNDMWQYDLGKEEWKLLHPGDYKLDEAKQNKKKIPSPRIGAKMVQIDATTIYIHNGHDNDNEKISDMWKFDITSNQWTEIV